MKAKKISDPFSSTFDQIVIAFSLSRRKWLLIINVKSKIGEDIYFPSVASLIYIKDNYLPAGSRTTPSIICLARNKIAIGEYARVNGHYF